MKTLYVNDEGSFLEAADYLCSLTHNPDLERQLAEKTRSTEEIVEAVRLRGDEAVAEFTARFDKVELTPDQFEVTPDEIAAATAKVDHDLLAALERAHGNIHRFHARNLRHSWDEEFDDGTILGQRVTSIASAGVYVPGGKAFYPSSVLMNIVPARVAGVDEIIMVSPPSFEGGIHPVVLAAAKLAGATRVFRVGGAQAIAALAYGTKTIPSVLKITGPGNTFVAVAKRLVRHICDIDTEAGPSEVVVIADEKANPACVAAELLAQAEHDEEAFVVVLTPSQDIAERTAAEVDRQTARMPRKEIITKAIASRGTAVVVRDLAEAIRMSDLLAPEHLSVQVEFPRRVLDKIRNAGAIMLGANTPVAVGDYYAGPNHILPTGRRARFASPLTAEDFRKTSSIIYYSRDRLMKDANDICMMAEAEGLTAHANAVEVRKP